jgi:tRNA G46 methylase TrmB
MSRFEDLLPGLYFPDSIFEYYTTDDKYAAEQQQISLLYGELTPVGVRQLGDPLRLDFEHSKTIYDLGMGAGKVVLQIYHEYPTVTKVVGIEYSRSRYDLAQCYCYSSKWETINSAPRIYLSLQC